MHPSKTPAQPPTVPWLKKKNKEEEEEEEKKKEEEEEEKERDGQREKGERKEQTQ